ncbi:MFS transporter [Leifsonia naganoensis]|uniref:MFS transporter n=1 Tax=Leifsonia naganoensis TaxID=150025 RepID=A0A853DIN4_9MICO|nr:hypothetical protein [Leifsonia naganoensis]
MNAVFSGSLGVPLVLTLDHAGVDKWGIAVFFVLWNLSGAAINLAPQRRLRAALGSSLILLLSSVAVFVGMLLLIFAFALPLAVVLSAAVLMAAYSVQYPIYLGRIVSSGESGARVGSSMASARRIWIFGYIAGLGAYSGVALMGGAALQVPLVALAVTVVLQIVWRRVREEPSSPPPHPSGDRFGGPRVRVTALVLLGVAISLLRATDSLRSTYFPLYAQHVGVTASVISLLFVATAVSELLVVRPLGRIGDRARSVTPLMLVAFVGACSMLLVAAGTSLWILITSQILYAFFTSGFQLFGVQRFVEATQHAERGASLYQGSLQIGGLVGILLPLLIAGYGPGIFVVGAVLCATALVTLLLNARQGRKIDAGRDRRHSHT